MTETSINLDKHKVNLETSLIPWSELQRFFAAGVAIFVAPDLDLVEVAVQVSKDNKVLVQQWMDNGQLGRVSDSQARKWFENSSEVWAVVVKPWVLVQQQADSEQNR